MDPLCHGPTPFTPQPHPNNPKHTRAGATTAAAAETYPSVTAAVRALPELSTLSDNLAATDLAAAFSDPNYVGTVFLPPNSALSAVAAKVGGDFTSLITSDPDTASQVFAYAVVPGLALTAAQLKDGMNLATKSGEPLAITVKR